MRQLADRVMADVHLRLAEIGRSIASSLASQQEAFLQKIAELEPSGPPLNPMVEAAYDAWKALPKGDSEPMDRFLGEYLKFRANSGTRKLLWNIIDASLTRPAPDRSGYWLVLGPKWVAPLTEELDGRIKLYGDTKNALLDYDASKPPSQRKREELLGAAFIEWCMIQRPGHNSTLVDAVANHLRSLDMGMEATRLSRRGELADEPLDIGVDDEMLEDFELREEAQRQIAMLRMLVEKANFTEQQRLVYEFDMRVGTDFTSISDATKAAAHHLSIETVTVRQHRRRYTEKLRQAHKAAGL